MWAPMTSGCLWASDLDAYSTRSISISHRVLLLIAASGYHVQDHPRECHPILNISSGFYASLFARLV